MSVATPQVGQRPFPSFEAVSPVEDLIEKTKKMMEDTSTPSKTGKLAIFKSVVLGVGRTILVGALLVVLLPLLLALTFLLLIIAVPIVLPIVAIIEAKKKFIG